MQKIYQILTSITSPWHSSHAGLCRQAAECQSLKLRPEHLLLSFLMQLDPNSLKLCAVHTPTLEVVWLQLK